MLKFAKSAFKSGYNLVKACDQYPKLITFTYKRKE